MIMTKQFKKLIASLIFADVDFIIGNTEHEYFIENRKDETNHFWRFYDKSNMTNYSLNQNIVPCDTCICFYGKLDMIALVNTFQTLNEKLKRVV